MQEQDKVVNPEEATTSEQVVNETATDQQPQEQQQTDIQAQEVTSTPEVKQESTEVDDRGVPWKNVAHEALRKITELETRLPDVLKSVLSENKQTQPEQPRYTKAQLLAYTQDPNISTEHRAWAFEEIERIDKAERKREMEEMFNAYTSKTQGDIQRRESMRFVSENFPSAVIKDNAGNFVGWNNSDPLVQRIDYYMKADVELAKHPSGLVAAAKMAAFDLGIATNKGLQKKVSQTTAQLKREQKKTLIAGGGVTSQQDNSVNSKVTKIAEEYRKTRNPEALKTLLKHRGLLPTQL